MPYLPKQVKSVVGTSICFPENGGKSDNSLCTDNCGANANNQETVKRVCEYVDGIMGSLSPFVNTEVRDFVDKAICEYSFATTEEITAREKVKSINTLFTVKTTGMTNVLRIV
jgi:hypothetical protein